MKNKTKINTSTVKRLFKIILKKYKIRLILVFDKTIYIIFTEI